MGSQLLKLEIGGTYIPGIPGTPGSPGVQAQPAYWEAIPTAAAPPTAPIGWTYQVVFDYSGASEGIPPTQTLVQVPLQPSGGAGAYSAIATAPVVYRYVYHPATAGSAPVPATPGTPGQYIPAPGAWNAGAVSVKALASDGNITFRAGAGNNGAVVGLAAGMTTDYRAITTGLYFHGGYVQVVEGGATKTASSSYAAADVWTLRRVNGVVTALKNGTTIYTSATPSRGPVNAVADLYLAGDGVYDLAITDTAHGSVAGSFLNMVGVAGLKLNYANGWSLPMTGTIRASGNGSTAGAFMPLQGSIGRRYASVAGSFLKMTGSSSQGGLMPAPPSTAHGNMLPLMGSIHGFTGGVGHVAGSFRKMDATIGRRYGKVAGALAPLFGQISAFPPGVVYMDSYAVSASDCTTVTALIVTADSSGTITSAMVVDVSVPVDISSSATATDAYILTQIDTLSIDSTANAYDLSDLGTTLGAVPPGVSVWVLNVDTKASTRYDHFNYDSFATINGRLYGTMADGVYLLEGADDAGAPIVASLSLGVKDFQSLNDPQMAGALKRVPAVYIGVAANKTMYLKVHTAAGDFIYAARSSSPNLAQQRFDVGQGLRSSYWGFELYNSTGSDFSLASVEFMPVKLARRIG